MVDYNSILDSNSEFDENKLKILENLVEVFYKTTNNNERTVANHYLNQYKTMENSWQHSDKILTKSNHTLTKIFAATILEDLVKTKFNLLSGDQKQVIRNFVIEVLIKTINDNVNNMNDQLNSLINKLNLTVVAIAKSEWVSTWPNFMSEICSAGKSTPELCENNLKILIALK